ncbi:hypothetical protein N7512_000050 [Penicillium capsulatum]|nr:hypothetical protein N7512_000050 [Penicillium capsulatum]
MSTTATTLPSGISAPLTTDNENDHSGLVVIFAAFGLLLVLAALGARIHSSYHRHTVQRDDYTFGGLVVVALAQAAVALSQVHHGWGTRTDSTSALTVTYAAELLSMVVLGLSKITICVFYDSLFSQMQRRVIRGLMGAMVVWMILSVLLLAIRCTDSPWQDISTARCGSLFPRWQAITAIDVTTEMLLLIYSGFAIAKIRISLQKKIMVLVALESRILLVPLAAIRLYYIKQQLNSTDPTLIGAYATVLNQLYLALSVLCQVTAFLKSFIAVYESEEGISYTEGTSTSKAKSKKAGSAYSLSHKIFPYSSGTQSSASADPVKGWERDEDPIMDPAEAGEACRFSRRCN